MQKKLCKDEKNQKLCGVCAGFAKYFSIDPTIVRLALVAFCLLGGSGVLAYIICALVMPDGPTDTDIVDSL
ncbi:MAG: PspC domain-containing protein [Oscillospiraceae bacterium]|nr:PspC domain-containing protein [Oscillospiraceae bacterium]